VSLNTSAAPSEHAVSLLRRSDGDAACITVTRSARHCVAGSKSASLLQDNLLGLTGYYMYHQVSCTEIMRPAHTCTRYLYVLYGSHNKERLVPCMIITGSLFFLVIGKQCVYSAVRAVY
jgi:hypothetical protein